MALLIGVLRIYGWYVATMVALNLLLVAVVWLRRRVARRWKNRGRPGLGHSAHPTH